MGIVNSCKLAWFLINALCVSFTFGIFFNYAFFLHLVQVNLPDDTSKCCYLGVHYRKKSCEIKLKLNLAFIGFYYSLNELDLVFVQCFSKHKYIYQ